MSAWTPPPPGDRREQLPAAILNLLPERPYVSTACDTGYILEADTYGAVRRWGRQLPDGVTLDDLETWIKRLHKRCRLNHKFTGRTCSCQCHNEQPTGVVADCRTCRGHRVVPDWTTRNGHGEPKPKPCPDCQTPPAPDPGETDTITVDNPRNTGWYWTCTACQASVGKYSTDDQARAQAAIDHPQCPPDPNGPYAWTIPAEQAATEATEEQNLAHALGGDRTAEVIAHTLTVHGHTLNAVRTMTDAELFAVPGIGGTSLARVRAALDAWPEPDGTAQAEPAAATAELVDLVDRHGTTRKTRIPRTQADHTDGLYLPIVLVVITHTDGRILVHQRAATKTQPGAIDHVCGAIRTGETPDEAAHRETSEETGATLTSLRLVHAGVNEHGRYRHLYTGTTETPDEALAGDPGEVAWVGYVPADQLQDGHRVFVKGFFEDLAAATEPEICGAESPLETIGPDGRVWEAGDCYCTLKPHPTGEHRCQPCTDRHGAPGWTDDTDDTAAPAGLRDQLAAAIWERQNPGRRYTDCEHPWQADAEADADAVLAALTLRLDFGEEQAWCKTCRRAWHGTDHRCESDAEQAVTRVRNECDRLEAAVRDNPTTPDFDGAYLTAIGHVRTALTPPQEPTP